MCQYQRGTWECRGDGYLWDADKDGYDPGEADYPCPECNTHEFLVRAKEYAESVSEASQGGDIYFQSWTGAEWWKRNVAYAKEINPIEARKAELALCPVAALVPSSDASGYAVETIAAT